MSIDLVGSRLGKYEVQNEIGKGGMGWVFQGYDPMLDRRVAIKVLAPHLVWETGFVDRFLREARAAARLKHASIVTIFDVGQEGNWYYIVMEYLEGPTLAQLINQHGPFSSKRALPILRQLADALDYAHSRDLVHRDVKPGNVVVDTVGKATLTDFGVARAAQETRLTSTGALVGTPQYMSPEQARGEDLDYRTDIYSLGVVAFEMLTGRAPFGATTPHAVLHQLIYDPPPPLRLIRPDLSPGAGQVLEKVLSKEPEARYETSMAFVRALEQTLAGQAGPVGPQPQAQAAGPKPPVKRKRPHPVRTASKGQGRVMALTWLGWLVASAVGWSLGWVLGPPLSEALAGAVADAVYPFPAHVIAGTVDWAIIGLTMGVGQWLVLRRHITRAGWWVVVTAVSLAVVGAVKSLLGPYMDDIIFDLIGWTEYIGGWRLVPLVGPLFGVLMEGLSGLVVGLAQRPVLRRQVGKAGRWVPISALAWGIGSAVVALVIWMAGEPSDEMAMQLTAVMGGVVLGVVTGLGLVWLLAKGNDE
jgi:hypothetical protein